MAGLVDWSHFFDRAIIGLIISLDKAVGLAINKAILMGIDITIGFSGLFL